MYMRIYFADSTQEFIVTLLENKLKEAFDHNGALIARNKTALHVGKTKSKPNGNTRSKRQDEW